MSPVKRVDLKGPAMAFVTTTVMEWSPIFSRHECAESTLEVLAQCTRRFNVSVYGYVLMPSHLHLLAGFPKIESLSEVIGSFKSLSSRQVKVQMSPEERRCFTVENQFNLWKRRFDDLIVWSEKQFLIKLAYIHSNPVKAGLVHDASEYVSSSAGDWLISRPGRIEISRNWSWNR